MPPYLSRVEEEGIALYPRYPVQYQSVRKVLAPQYQNLPSEAIEQILRQTFGEQVDPEDIEGLFGDIGNFVSGAAKSITKTVTTQVAPAVTKALPTVLPVAGTVLGTAFGGPLGGALGGALGSAAGSAIGGRSSGGSSNVAGSVIPAIAGIAGGAFGGPVGSAVGQMAAGGLSGGRMSSTSTMGSPSATALLQILPQILPAIQAMAMGQTGRSTLPIANRQVAVSDIGKLVSLLANQAAEEFTALNASNGEATPDYLLNANGEFWVDPAVPEQRAAAVLHLMNQELYPAQPALTIDHHRLARQRRMMELEDFYDELELADLDEDYETWED